MMALILLLILALVLAVIFSSPAKVPPRRISDVREDFEVAQEIDPGLPDLTVHERTREDPSSLPAPYGEQPDDLIVVLVRNPYSLYAYWEISERHQEALRITLGDTWDQGRPVLRLLDVSGGPDEHLEVEIGEHDDHWFIDEGLRPGHRYVVSLARRLPDGSYQTISHSTIVQMPHDRPVQPSPLHAGHNHPFDAWSETVRR